MSDSSPADSSAPSDVAQGTQREVEAVVQNATDNVEFSQLALGKVKAESWLKNQLLLQAEEVTKQFETQLDKRNSHNTYRKDCRRQRRCRA